MLANAMESNVASLWFTSCVVGGLVSIAIGARAGGLALLGTVPGAFVGLMVGSNFDLIPRNMMVGASVGAFVAGLAGLKWRPWAPPWTLCALGSVTILMGAAAGWAAYLQACDGYERRCLPEVNPRSLALFALDVAWVAALCFIQAIQAARSKPADVEPAHVGGDNVADASSR